MQTRVYARYHDASALDCMYLGTVDGFPEDIARRLRAMFALSTTQVRVERDEIIVTGSH